MRPVAPLPRFTATTPWKCARALLQRGDCGRICRESGTGTAGTRNPAARHSGKEGRKDSAAHTTLKDHPLNYNCFDVSAGSEEED